MIKKRQIMFTYLVIAIFLVCSLLFSLSKNQEACESVLTEHTNLIDKEYNSTIRNYQEFTRTLFGIMISDEEVLNLFAQGALLEDTQQQEQLRSQLYVQLLHTYEVLKAHGFRQVHFHDRNNNSYLRMHRPELYGDDLSRVRPSVVEVNLTGTPQHGFEEGKIFNGFRFVYPVFSADEQVGSVELSITMQVIIDQLEESYGRESLFILHDTIVQQNVLEEEQDNYELWSVDEHFLIDSGLEQRDLVQGKDKEKFQQLIRQELASHDVPQEQFSLTYETDQTMNILTFYPVIDFSEQAVGYLVVLSESLDLYIVHSTRLRIIIYILILFMILSITHIFIFRYIKKKDDILKQLNIVSDGTHLGIWDWDIPSGDEQFNRILTELLGYRLEEVTPHISWWKNKIHPEDLPAVNRDLEAYFAGETPIYENTHRLMTKTGIWRWFNDYGQVVKRDKTGHPIRMVGTLCDVTDQIHNEQEILKAEKLSSIGILAGGIAHDFNNILTGIYGSLSLLKFELGDTHESIGYIDDTEMALDRAAKLTRQLLTFSKRGAPVKTKVDLLSTLQNTVSFDLSGSNIKPVFNLPQEPLMVSCDEGQIDQVFTNLVTNARQASPSGGTLEISLDLVSLEQNERPGLLAGSYARISFKDEGAGITKGDLEKLFDPYFTTKASGNGLGLASSYSIMKRHRGMIYAESELGIGSVFTLFLPTDLRETVVSIPEISREPVPTDRSSTNRFQRVLIMDDDKIIRIVLMKMLAVLGYESMSTCDGKEAIEYFWEAYETDSPFDLLIFDLTVPDGMGGKQALSQLLKRAPEITAIASSGYEDQDYLQAGFKASIKKPYLLAQLEQVINSLAT